MGLALIVMGDTAGKALTNMGANPTFVAWMRFVIAVPVLLPLVGLKRSDIGDTFKGILLLRGALIATAVFCMVTALKTEPIANVFGAFFISPILMFILSVIFLKEGFHLLRGALIVVGFIGVMLVVKPGFGGGIGMYLALLAGACHAVYLIVTRKVSGTYRPQFMLISQLVVGALVLAPFGISAPIPTVNTMTFALLCVSALGSGIGNYMLVIASKTTPASLMAPLIYTQLIYATLAGFIVFGHIPDMLTLIGLGLILASGFLSFSKPKSVPPTCVN